MISIIIPVYNSELTIENLINSIIINLNEKVKYEIILVNDSSEDNSENICKELVEKFSNISLFSLSKNFGEHNAILAGLKQCVGDQAVIMSDDLQHTSEALLELINYGLREKENYDVIYTFYEKKKYSFYKNFFSKLNDLMANYLLNKPKNLYLSSFKLINRFVINELIKNNSPYVYLDGLILGTTNKIGKIKVNHSNRLYGKSGYTFIKMVKLWSNMSTSFSIFPLRLSMLMGVVLSFIGFILAIIIFFERIFDSTVPSGFASIFVAVTVFSGVILIALGVIGEYIGRIFLLQNQKPQFIIKNSWKKK
jgi:glycosyltransferase involved in cell wall biosynthesis